MKRSVLWKKPLPFRSAARLCWACSCMPMRVPAAVRKPYGSSASFTGADRRVMSGSRIPQCLPGLGDTEEAFVWLERAAEERSNILQFLKVHPFFDSLRGPAFAEFLRRRTSHPSNRQQAPA